MAKVNSGLPVKGEKPSEKSLEVHASYSQAPVVEAAAGTVGVFFMTCDVPCAEVNEREHSQEWFNLRLDSEDALKVRAIYAGLDRTNAKLKNGRYVNSPAGALRWMVQNFECKKDL